VECGGQVPIIAAESEKAMIIVQNDFAAESEMVFVFTAVVKFFFTIKK
jgi:hypothetical protein